MFFSLRNLLTFRTRSLVLPVVALPISLRMASAESSASISSSPASSNAFQVITLGGGCFWCIEAVFRQVEGVYSAVSGYMGGHVENPTYEQVCGKKTGHVEVVQVTFDPSVVSVGTILDWFFRAHDPTQFGGQGNDIGPQYISAVFVSDEEQRRITQEKIRNLEEELGKKLATEIREASTFWTAEKYHQDYYFQDGGSNPYCRAVITPKLKKLDLKH